MPLILSTFEGTKSCRMKILSLGYYLALSMIGGTLFRTCSAQSFVRRWTDARTRGNGGRYCYSELRVRHGRERGLSHVLLRGGDAQSSSFSIETKRRDEYLYQYILALGSNLGDRYQNIVQALDILCQNQSAVTGRTSFLYETAPRYVTEQPKFLNAAIEVYTSLEPHDFLARCKTIEQTLGRDFGAVRNGPRPIDLDILVCRTRNSGPYRTVDAPNLIIPHPRIRERDFVLVPLLDIMGTNATLPCSNETLSKSLEALADTEAEPSMVRVLPLPRGRLLRFGRTLIMGILNVTPDSFSDGAKWTAVTAVQRALEMERDGADIIDIGGESTRPGAQEVAIDEELRRTIPVIQGIRKESDVPLSIDTRHAVVAKAAIEAGADIVNDVSGGTFDADMFPTVASLQVPMAIMHMRGTPETMQTLTEYDDLLRDVGSEFMIQAEKAEDFGIRRWCQVADPGIGFAKDLNGNLTLLRNLRILRQNMDRLPLLLGTSRKGFIGKLTGTTKAEDRDPGTISSCVAAICLENDQGCNILRVHNVRDCRQAVRVVDAILLNTAI